MKILKDENIERLESKTSGSLLSVLHSLRLPDGIERQEVCRHQWCITTVHLGKVFLVADFVGGHGAYLQHLLVVCRLALKVERVDVAAVVLEGLFAALGAGHQLTAKLVLDALEDGVERHGEEREVSHLRTLVVGGIVIEHIRGGHTEETAYLPHRELPRLQKLHIRRGEGNLLKITVTGQGDDAIAAHELLINRRGKVGKFVILHLAEARHALVVGHEAPHGAAIGKPLFRLVVARHGNAQRTAGMGDDALAPAPVAGMQVEVNHLRLVERAEDAIIAVGDDVLGIEDVMGDRALVAKHQIGQLSQHIAGEDVGVALQQHQRDGMSPEVVCRHLGLGLHGEQIMERAADVLHIPAALERHVFQRKACHTVADHLHAAIHRSHLHGVNATHIHKGGTPAAIARRGSPIWKRALGGGLTKEKSLDVLY